MSQKLPKVTEPEDRPLTARQKVFVEHLLSTGETPHRFAQKLGSTPSNVYRELRKPHVKRYLQQRIQDHIGVLAVTATRVQGELLHAESEHVRANVAESILNRQLGKAIERRQVAFQGAINVNIDLS